MSKGSTTVSDQDPEEQAPIDKMWSHYLPGEWRLRQGAAAVRVEEIDRSINLVITAVKLYLMKHYGYSNKE